MKTTDIMDKQLRSIVILRIQMRFVGCTGLKSKSQLVLFLDCGQYHTQYYGFVICLCLKHQWSSTRNTANKPMAVKAFNC